MNQNNLPAMIPQLEKGRNTVWLLAGAIFVGGGVYVLIKYGQRKKYMRMAANGDKNVIAAQKAYDLLPMTMQKANFLMRTITPPFLFKLSADVESLFSKEDFKMKFYRIVNEVTDQGLFYDSFKGMYGFDLRTVLDKVLGRDAAREIMDEAKRPKNIAAATPEKKGKFVIVNDPSGLGYNDIMFFLKVPAGWPGGYAWNFRAIPKGIYMGQHAGEETYIVADGKTKRAGIIINIAQPYTVNGTKYIANARVIVDASKVRIATTDPSATNKRFSFWNYTDQTAFIRDYVTKAAKMKAAAAAKPTLKTRVWDAVKSQIKI